MVKYTPVSGIYVIINQKNGKVYVGKAVDFRGRWAAHKAHLRGNYHVNRHLQAAWNKYGEKWFKFLKLEYCPVEQLDEREKHHIAIYKARGLAYNMTDGGEGSLGHIPSEATRRKTSEAMKGKIRTEEHQRKLNEAQKGRIITEEHRRKIGEANKNPSAETLRKMSEASKGRTHSDESRRKTSEALKGANSPSFGKTLSAETRHKISEALKGKRPSEETRRKLSEAHKRAWQQRKEQSGK